MALNILQHSTEPGEGRVVIATTSKDRTYELESISKTSKSLTIFWQGTLVSVQPPHINRVSPMDLPCDLTSCGCCILSEHV